jgi:hypothetical protein
MEGGKEDVEGAGYPIAVRLINNFTSKDEADE